MRLTARNIKVNYLCPNDNVEYITSVDNDQTYYSSDYYEGYAESEVIFHVDCPCGERHEVKPPY